MSLPQSLETLRARASTASQPQMQPAEGRYDSPPNLYLSHIQSLMEEDDEEASSSFGALLAYRAKASELAELLKEDSPALKLHFTFTAQHAADRPSANECPLNLQLSSYQSHLASWMLQVNAGSTLSNRLGPPRPFSIRLSWFLSRKLLDTALCRSARLCLPTSTKAEGESGVAFGNLINAIYFSQGGRRTENADDEDFSVLQPPKETGLQACSRTRAPCSYVDLNDLLVSCTRAIGLNDTNTAMKILVEVKRSASPNGNGAQRLAYYFAEALEARMAGTGWQIYMGCMAVNRPSAEAILKAACMYMTNSPFAKAFRFYVNRKILDVAKDASMVHIIEYQVTGTEYPSLFKALAARPGGPPQVRLIAANTPHSSWVSKEKEAVLNLLEQTGRQLAICAASYGVPFHFTAWVGYPGAFPMQDYVSANRRSEEVLVVLTRYPMRYTYDEVLNPPEKRLETLKTIRALKAEAFIHGFATGSYNTPFFSHRFREALNHFGSHYDMLDTFVNRKYPGRMVFESEILGKAVLNVVACENVNVVERVDRHKQRYAVAKLAGLRQIRLDAEIKGEVQKIMKSWHNDYMVDEDLNYLLMGWRGRILYAIATWTGKNPIRCTFGGVGRALVSV